MSHSNVISAVVHTLNLSHTDNRHKQLNGLDCGSVRGVCVPVFVLEAVKYFRTLCVWDNNANECEYCQEPYLNIYIHTHTYTVIYIYIYIYMSKFSIVQ